MIVRDSVIKREMAGLARRKFEESGFKIVGTAKLLGCNVPNFRRYLHGEYDNIAISEDLLELLGYEVVISVRKKTV